MKPGRILVGFVLLAVLVGSACNFITQGIQLDSDKSVGSGTWITVKRPLDSFDTIVLETYGNVTVEIGAPEMVQIDAPQDAMEFLKSDVRAGTLYLEMAAGVNLDVDRPIVFRVTVPELEEIRLLGSGAFRIPEINPPRFDMILGGSGEIFAEDIDTPRLSINVLGSGNVSVQGGQADEQIIRLAGSGQVNSSGLESRHADVSITGSGEVILWVTEELDISIPGSGDVSYYGEPRVVNESIRGSGNVLSLGAK